MKNYSVSGLVATTPRHIVTFEGLAITSFRLAEIQEDAPEAGTNWYTVTTFKQTAINAAASISKGDRVVVVGNLKIRDWDNGERSGTSLEIEATKLGHDLSQGTSEFTPTPKPAILPDLSKHECSCGHCEK